MPSQAFNAWDCDRGGWLVQEARQATQLLFMGSFLAGPNRIKDLPVLLIARIKLQHIELHLRISIILLYKEDYLDSH